MSQEQDEAKKRLRELIPHLLISKELAESPRLNGKAEIGVLRINNDSSGGQIISSFDMIEFMKDLMLVTEYVDGEQ